MGLFSRKNKGNKVKTPKSGGLVKVGETFTRQCNKLEQAYEVGELLGTGGFAEVKKGVCKETKSSWALKMIKMDTYKKNKAATDDEVEVLQGLKHPGIVLEREVVVTNKHFVIVLELLGGGELFDRIVMREKYSEDDAKEVTRTILQTVAYLHENKCVHRDLKPENLIFADTSEQAQLKITDFGFASRFEESGKLSQSCGTPEYVAPEILEDKPYDEKCDVWSVGVIVYILLCGFPPFYADEDDELFAKIGAADFEFVEPYWDNVSEKGKEFVDRLLTVKSTVRPSAREALSDPWLTSGEKGGDLNNIDNLKRFNATRKLRRAVHAVIAMNRFKMAFDVIKKEGDM